AGPPREAVAPAASASGAASVPPSVTASGPPPDTGARRAQAAAMTERGRQSDHFARALEALAKGSEPTPAPTTGAAPKSAGPPAPPASDGVVVRHLSLVDVAEVVSNCRRCSLADTRTNTVFSRGTGSSGLCFVGEGPGAEEDARGLPFVGAAGQLLDRMIEAMGLSPDDVY